MKQRMRSFLSVAAVALIGLAQFPSTASADDPPPVVLGPPPLASDGTLSVWQLPHVAPYNEASVDNGKSTMHVYLTVRAPRARNVIKACNAAPNVNRFYLRGTGPGRKFRVTYRRSGKNVTSAVVAGTFRTPRLAENACIRLRMRITRTAAARRGDKRRFTLTLTAKHEVFGPASVSVVAHAKQKPATTG